MSAHLTGITGGLAGVERIEVFRSRHVKVVREGRDSEIVCEICRDVFPLARFQLFNTFVSIFEAYTHRHAHGGRC